MNIFSYETYGGKDLVRDFLDKLPKRESAEGYFILESLESQGTLFLYSLNTRQIEDKL